MNWIQITVEDLEDSKVAALLTALRTAALADGQSDPTPRLTQAVVDRIRRKIASCQNNQLDSDPTTIPKGLKTMAVDLIIAELKGRLEEELTSAEKTAIERHATDLNRIAECKDVVEQPDDAVEAEVQATGGSPSITECRREDRHTRRGL